MAHIRAALDTARRRNDLVILLGLDPESPEVEYGWIEPSAPILDQSRVYGVRRFWEKPNQLLAQVLQLRGCLWNSFVMVASVQALLGIIESAIPQLHNSATPNEPPMPNSQDSQAKKPETFVFLVWRFWSLGVGR